MQVQPRLGDSCDEENIANNPFGRCQQQQIGGNDIVLFDGLGNLADSLPFARSKNKLRCLVVRMVREPMIPQWFISGSCITFRRSFGASIKSCKPLGISGSAACVFAHADLTTLLHLGLSSLYKEKMV
jgi:hypothetical protein